MPVPVEPALSERRPGVASRRVSIPVSTHATGLRESSGTAPFRGMMTGQLSSGGRAQRILLGARGA